MLNQQPLPDQTCQRNLLRERELWNNRGNTLSLGCLACPEQIVCGGLQVSATLFDCLAHCCNKPQDCDSVCRKSPDFVDRIREINGFDLTTVPRTSPIVGPRLSAVIPMLYHGGQRKESFVSDVVCLPLFSLIKPNFSGMKFEPRTILCNAFKVATDAVIVLSGTTTDPPLERWWELGKNRRIFIRALRDLNVALVTTPNYSLFTDQPRWNDLHNMKRIALVWQEFVEEGLQAALHVNARTDTDWNRWIDFIGKRPEVTHIAYEFGTGAGWQNRIDWHAEHLANLALSVGRPLSLVIRGGHQIIPIVSSFFDRVSIIETSTFLKTINRQFASLTACGLIEWKRSPTQKGEPLDRLMDSNFRTIETSLRQIYGLA